MKYCGKNAHIFGWYIGNTYICMRITNKTIKKIAYAWTAKT